jgi:hypothetical protein
LFKRKKRDGLGIGIADHNRKSPLRADEQSSPQPERPVNTEQDEQNPDLGRDRPSQAEGER